VNLGLYAGVRYPWYELELGQELNKQTLSGMEGWSEVLEKGAGVGNIVKGGGFFGFFLFMYDIQHCFICRPSDSTVS
jgi:hypothetical protein